MHENIWDLASLALAAPEYIGPGDELSISAHSLARWDTVIASHAVDIVAMRRGIEPVTILDDATINMSVRWENGTQAARYFRDGSGKVRIDQRFPSQGENPIVPTRRLVHRFRQPNFDGFFEQAAEAVSGVEPVSNYTKILLSRGEDQVTASTYWTRDWLSQTTHRLDTRFESGHLLAAYNTTARGDKMVEIGYEDQASFSQEQLKATASGPLGLISSASTRRQSPKDYALRLCSVRHFAISPWCPLSSTLGTAISWKTSGLVYCGNSIVSSSA